jgi:hypothetical protein
MSKIIKTFIRFVSEMNEESGFFYLDPCTNAGRRKRNQIDVFFLIIQSISSIVSINLIRHADCYTEDLEVRHAGGFCGRDKQVHVC